VSLSRAPTISLLAALAAGCGEEASAPAPSCSGTHSQAQSASAEGRWLIGQASRYPADTALAARADTLHRSIRARRAAAWAAVARTLAPVPLARPVGVAGATVPRFQTWYDRQDVVRVFQRLYEGLGPEGRRADARFDDAALDEAFGFSPRFVTTLPEWPAERLAAYASSVSTAATVAGVSGVLRVAASPDAVRHLVQSYPEVLRCINEGGPPDFVDGPPAAQQVAREPVALTACGTRTAGPFFVASGGSLTARVEGAGAGVSLRVVEGVGPDAPVRCEASAAEGCAVTGPGLFLARVTADGRGAAGMLDVRATPPTTRAAPCLHGVFPPQAATVALEWRRTDLGMPLPTYDTSAAGLRRRLAPGADATWGEGDGTADPSAAQAYTMRLAVGTSFRLAAMHIRTREVDGWLNITLWWSPRPDEDFGADRPAEVRGLGGPWSSYKMCVATDFDELDPDPAGGFGRDAPSLAAALRAVHEGVGGPSWCSNPYIDAGPGLVRSNCVGCHQHAMSGVRPATVQNDPLRYPANGRAQVRNNSPADGFWGLDGGDHLASVFAETVDFWRNTQ
jgi:hypothetical protein